MIRNSRHLSFCKLVLVCTLLLASAANSRVLIPLEAFFKRDQFEQIKLSPAGEYLAATIPMEDRTSLVILRRADMAMTGHVTLEPRAHVMDFTWVNDGRLLFTVAKREGKFAQPSWLPGLYGVNVDGSGQGDINVGNMNLLDDLRDDDQYVLVSHPTPQKTRGVGRLDVDTGTFRRTPVLSPVENAGFITDNASKVRFVSGRRSYEVQGRLYQYHEEDGRRWELINDENVSNQAMYVLGFSADNSVAYIEVEQVRGPNALYSFDMATGKRELLLRDDNVNPWQLLASPIDGGAYAVRFLDGRPRIEYLDEAHPFALDLKKMQAAFPEAHVYPGSFSKDGGLGIYVIASDVVPAQYYLYDRATGKASFLAERASWLDPSQLSRTQPVKFSARDGVEIEGFLTTPLGSEARDLPLVVNPHGGPFGVFDTWGYSSETQMLANRGYAVLQVNFRGSGNYGRAFEVLGHRQWGGSMQDDLTDATKWAISQGIADPERICIYGASYGGYAALMGVVREPGLYRCAVGNVGVYDLAKVYADDGTESGAAKQWFKQTMGEEQLRSLSPNRLASQIRVPVLLAAGQKDWIAPQEHTKMMAKALQNAGVPVESVIYPGEAHGNYLIANQVDWAKRLLSFLEKNLGPGAPVVEAKTAH